MTDREFAIEVVTKLQRAKFQALWAGGCVRDQLLGIAPKDYDVATSAQPDQIRELFGKKRTLAIGAAFGVITILGPRGAGQIEVATFRRDGNYSDGRRPDQVEYTNAREDALRRDFTINGMFYDPLTEEVIDYIDGQVDLQAKLIRAIGDPHQRIAEDKLRMLRAIRFAATYAFQLEPGTIEAIKQNAAEINAVSQERIGAELVRMLAHRNQAVAAANLLSSGLLLEILPADWELSELDERWDLRLAELERSGGCGFEAAVVLLLRDFLTGDSCSQAASQLQSAWRLTNQQRDTVSWIANHWECLAAADQKRWSEVQPCLIHKNGTDALDVAHAVLGETDGENFCRQRLTWPAERLNPSPLLVGADLIQLGLQPNPQFKSLLQQVRDRQLDGLLDNVEQAKQWVCQQI